jgi:hypothetical protein
MYSLVGSILWEHGSCEKVSVSLVYALGLWTDQTPPICVSKRNTAGIVQNRVGSREGKLGEMGA